MKKTLILYILMLYFIFISGCGSVSSSSTAEIPGNNGGDIGGNGNSNLIGLIVQSKTFVTSADQELKINLKSLLNDPDINKVYRYILLSAPNIGLAKLDNELLTYTPSQTGNDEIKFRVLDGSKESNVGQINITVNSSTISGNDNNGNGNVNQLILLDKSSSIMQDEFYQLSLTSIIKNYNSAGSYNFFVITPPEHGQISVNNMVLTYKPDLGYLGQEEFVLRAGDGYSTSNDAVISILIQDITTSTPRLQNYTYKISPNTPVTLDLLLLLLPPHPFSGKVYEFTILQQGRLGAGVIENTNLVFTPILNALGSDTSMRILVKDELGQVSETNITIVIQP